METLEHASSEMKANTLEIKEALGLIVKEAGEGDSYISEMKDRATIIQEDYDSFKGMGNKYYSDAENVKEYFDKFNEAADNINQTMEEIINIIDDVVVGIKQCTAGTGNISDSIQELAGNMSQIRESSEVNNTNFENLEKETRIFH